MKICNKCFKIECLENGVICQLLLEIEELLSKGDKLKNLVELFEKIKNLLECRLDSKLYLSLIIFSKHFNDEIRKMFI